MDTGIYGNLNTPQRLSQSSAPFGLELVVDCRPREFWQFEPIQLDLELRLVGGQALSINVPDEFDPGHQRFRLLIEDPNGERRLAPSLWPAS